MTVRELIAELSKVDPDFEVYVGAKFTTKNTFYLEAIKGVDVNAQHQEIVLVRVSPAKV